MGQTVNLLAFAFGGSNPSVPTQRRDTARRLFFVFTTFQTIKTIHTMSDGNINRSLLPHTEFHNGYRAATTRTKVLAAEAFREAVEGLKIADSEKQAAYETFCRLLNDKVKGNK